MFELEPSKCEGLAKRECFPPSREENFIPDFTPVDD
jgi:hypothetical protein